MASRQFIQEVGLMDERFFRHCEEQDWAYRAARWFELMFGPRCLCVAQRRSKQWLTKAAKEFFSIRYLIRSRILLTLKHLPIVLLSIEYATIRQ